MFNNQFEIPASHPFHFESTKKAITNKIKRQLITVIILQKVFLEILSL
jgi:hypothetical protein